ncbi:hypothetical protein ACFPN0_31450 [Kitasatospora cinereorecta]
MSTAEQRTIAPVLTNGGPTEPHPLSRHPAPPDHLARALLLALPSAACA